MSFLAAVIPALTGGTALGALSAGLGVAGALFEGVAAKNAANYRAGVASQNARIEEQNAKNTMLRGQIDAQDQDLVASQELADMTSRDAASGLLLSGESYRQKGVSARLLARRDSLRILHDSYVQAVNQKQSAHGFRSEAASERAAGKSAMFGALLGAGGSLINSATRVKQDKYRAITAGVYS